NISDTYKTSAGSSHNNFSILAKIVKHLKVRHQTGETQPLTFDEILDETGQTDIPARTKHWLNYEALRNNVKIDVVNEDKYIYKPEYNIRGKNSLKKLLERHSREGQGGIFLEAIEESLPNYQKHLEMMSDSIVRITRPDKKEIIFSKVVGLPDPIDEEIKNLWRSVSVEGMNENKIQEYLQKHNISSMKNINHVRPKKVNAVSPTKRKTSKKSTELRHNAHLAGILMDYDRNQ
ncbi:hypothetical protein HELRODRAFT_73187, partial [Helobdella robusta]|uniref:TFIIE beta domain-containing protein n=1 Tax=Helobdella robusta TaxID=6412 RepID=T1G1B4_HELRO